MMVPPEKFDEIAQIIASDVSPVGIDAKKTHVMLLYMVGQIQSQLERIENRLDALEAKVDAK